eukprot:m.30943 g.30943  ORF g.30943 m.30943 type:complete len:116 (+) comp16369_c1_seq1:846-1193(+)
MQRCECAHPGGSCVGPDECIDGMHCEGCVAFSPGVGDNTTLTFTRDNWQQPQRITVMYKSSGDTQFKVSSQDYYLKNSFDLQFSTCACKPGEHCSNECNMYCGTDDPSTSIKLSV